MSFLDVTINGREIVKSGKRVTINNMVNNINDDIEIYSSTDSNKEICSILKCPSCDEFPDLPIMLCSNGHSVCNSCRKISSCCKVCNKSLTQIPNTISEAIISKSRFSCKYARQGCPESIKGAELRKHIAKCIFRPILCNIPPCISTLMTNSTYIHHLKNSHGVPGKVLQGNSTSGVNISQDIRILAKNDKISRSHAIYCKLPYQENPPSFIIEYNKEHFFLNTRIVEPLIYWWTTWQNEFVAATEHSPTFASSITITDSSRYISTKWVGNVFSAKESFESIKSKIHSVYPISTLISLFGAENSNDTIDSVEVESDESPEYAAATWIINFSVHET